MDKPVISFDCDDVLANLFEVFYEEMSQHTGLSPCLTEFTDFKAITRPFGVEDYPSDLLLERSALERCPVLPGAQEAMEWAKRQDFHVIVVTARGWHPRAYDVTSSWLEKNSMPFDTLHVVPPIGSKTGEFDRYDNILCHIDDCKTHVESARMHKNIKNSIVMSKSWNFDYPDHHDNVHRLDSLRGFPNLAKSLTSA